MDTLQDPGDRATTKMKVSTPSHQKSTRFYRHATLITLLYA